MEKNIGKVTTYEVTTPFDILEGKVGAQIEGKKYLPGGGTQIQMLLDRNKNKMIYLKPISAKVIK